MYISVERTLLRQSLWYVIASAITALFGAVYEHFSHEVYSNFMLYAFAIPLVLGALPLLCFSLHGGKGLSCGWGLRLYGFGIATWTVGSLLKGVLDIYGTTNRLLLVYLYAGLLFVLLGAGICIAESFFRKR